MHINIITLYPEAFPAYLGISNLKKAMDNDIWSLEVINLRDFAYDKHKTVDSKPFGGGAGMLLKANIIGDAIEYVLKKYPHTKLIYPSAQGEVYNQKKAIELTKINNITFLCGHFEGIDNRVIEQYNPLEISVGDYILTGGELSTMIIIDSVLRLLPNVINSKSSIEEESFNNGLLEYPQYTQPRIWKGREVPEVLLSGNHKKINQWRHEKALLKTKSVRKDLWQKKLNNN